MTEDSDEGWLRARGDASDASGEAKGDATGDGIGGRSLSLLDPTDARDLLLKRIMVAVTRM